MRYSPRFLALSTAALVVFVTSCDQATRPATEGTISPQVIFVRDTAPLHHVVEPLETILLSVSGGPSAKTPVQLSPNAAHTQWTGTMGGLAPGAYKVTLEGRTASGQVQHFGVTTSDVVVEAGRKKPALITFADITPDLDPPPAPTTTSFSQLVQFTGVTGAIGYRVEASQDAAFGSGIVPANSVPPATSVTLNLNNTGLWFFRGRVTLPAGIGTAKWSASQTVTVQATSTGRTPAGANTTTPAIGTTNVAPIQNLTPAAGDTAVWFTLPNLRAGDTLILKAVANGLPAPTSALNTFISLYRADQTTLEASTGAGGVGTDAWLTHALPVAGTYYAKVTGELPNTVGHFEFSYLVERIPAAPTGFAAVAMSGTSVQLNWTDNANAGNGDQETGYLVQRCPGTTPCATTFATINTTAPDATGFLDNTGLTAGQTFTYRVFARNGSGDSPVAGPIAVSLVGPGAPIALTATTFSGTQIDLAWTDGSTNETGFRIEGCSGGACPTMTFITNVGPNVTAYSHTVSVDGSYQYQVMAINNIATSTATNIASANTIRPAAPTAPTATTAGATQINLTWTGNSNNETGFRVERCTGPNCNTGFSIVTTTGVDAVGYNDISAVFDNYYGYRISAVNVAGASATTAIVYANTKAPGAPASFTATIFSNSRVDLAWVDTSSAETGFVVDRCADAGCPSFGQLVSLPAGTTAYSDNTVVIGSTYSYRVRATGVAGNSANAGPANVAVLLPAAPGSLVATTVSTTQVNLAWSDLSNNESTFRIERCLVSACAYAEIDNVTAGTEAYSDVSVTAGNQYNYRIRANNAVGNSAYSNIAVASTQLPAAPTSFTATTISTTQIDLQWINNAGNADGYRIERCANAACPTFTLLVDLPPSAESYSNTVSAGNSYTYRVYAYNEAGNSGVAGPVTATTSVPAAPTGLTVAPASAGSMQLNWTDVATSETGYAIVRCQGVSCVPSSPPYDQAPANATGYVDNGVAFGATYNYLVYAFNAIGNSGNSNTTGATVQQPGELFNLSATTISGTRIDLIWGDTVTTETEVQVYRCTGPGCSSYALIAVLAPSTTAYSDLSVAVDQEYTYHVNAVNLVGSGINSNDAFGNTLRPFTPTSISAVANSPTQITLAWDNNANNELGYYVQRCVGAGCSNFTLVATVGVDVTQYVDTDVTADNSYSYIVLGYNIVGNSDQPAPVTASTFVPPAPSNLTATTQSDSQIDLTWTDNSSDEVGVLIERCEGNGCSNFAQVDSVGTDIVLYQSTGLNPNSEYTYRVRAVNASGYGNYSATASAATNLPGTPSALNALVQSATSIALGWTDNAAFPNAELGFKVERCTGAGCSSYAEIADLGANTTGYVDNTVLAADTYRYRVSAYNAVGASAFSNEVSVTTDVPVAPSVLLAFGSSPTTVGLQWSDDSNNEASFQIERCTGLGCSSFVLVGTVAVADSTGFLDTGLTAEQNYRYRVRAVNAVGPSAYSPIADANTKLPLAPSALSAAATSSTVVSMTWTDNATDEISYSVERCLGAGCSSFAVVATLALNSTSYINTGLTPNALYRYRVRAVNAVGAGPYSNIDDAPTDIPIDPSALTALAMSFTQIDLGWTDNSSNETGFIIERCTGGGCGNYAIIQLVGANVNSYSDPGLDPDQSYSYRIQAVRTGSGASGFTTPASAVTSIPGAPVNLFSSTITGSRIDLSWDDNANNELSMAVERCTGVACNDFLVIATLDSNVTTHSDLTAALNVTYRYRVQSANNVGASAYSNEASSNTLQPAITSGLSATTVSAGQIDLTWIDASTNETYFLLERCLGGACSDFTRLDSLGVGTTTFQDVTVTVGNIYRYRVASFNNSGTAGYDGPALATTLLPAEPTGVSAQVVTGSRIDLAWTDAADNEDGFAIERCSGIGCASFVQIVSLPAGTQAYSNTGLTQNTFYTYRVRAFNAAGTSPYAAPVDGNTFFPAAPNALTATTVLADQVNLTWNDNSNNESGFEIERCTGGGCINFATVATVGAEVEAYSDLTTVIGQTYRYRVRAVNGVGASGYTIIATALTSGVPADPSSLGAVTTSASTIQLNWTDNSSNELRFRIERCVGAGCSNYVPRDSVGAGITVYNDLGLVPTESFSYRVRAVNVGSSGASNSATATTILPNAPTALTAIGVSGTRADLAWTDNANNEFGFAIERCTGAGCSNFAALTTVAAGVTEYADNSLTADNTYAYRVRAYNGAGVSAYSNESAATTNVPGIPTALSATTISPTQIDLAWTDNATTEDRFRIERCTGLGCLNFLPVDSVAANVLVYSDVGLTSGLIFRYRVRAANVSGPSGYSNTATAGTNVPADPTGLAAVTISGGQVDLTWTDNADNELGFSIERCDAVSCSNFVQVATVGPNVSVLQNAGLTLGGDFRYRVRATNNAGNSGFTAEVIANTRVPADPTNLVATTISATRIDLAWTDNADNEASYTLERCVGAGCSVYSQLALLPANSTDYSDQGLVQNESYSYRITAGNVVGSSNTPLEQTATTNFPADPSGLIATTISATQVDLQWTDNANNESGFRIYRCDNADCVTDTYAQIFAPGANVTTFSDLSVTLGNSYGYRVEAFNVAGTSGLTADTATTLLPTDPTATALQFVDGTPTLLLSWTDNSNDEEQFLIERCEGVGCSSFVQVGAVGAGISEFQDVGVPTGDMVRYRVRASRAAGQSGYSAELELQMTVPDAASALDAITLSESQMSLTWADNATNEQGYRIEQCSGVSCSGFSEIAIVAANQQAYGVTGLTIGNVYRFRVRPFNVLGDGGNSNEDEADTFLPTDPASLVATTVAPGQIDLSWNDNAANEDTYRIERCSGVGCSSFVEIATVGTDANGYSNTGVSLNGVYRYRVRALNAVGASNYTNEDQANTLLPTSPGSLSATEVTGQRIDLSWGDATFEDGYQIEACVGFGCSDFTVVQSTGQDVTNIQLNGLTFGVNYQFRVRGLNVSGPSVYSNEVGGSTVLAAPTDVRATTTGRNSINVTWSDNTGIETEYRVERCAGAGCSSYILVAILPAGTTNFPNAGLAANQFFSFRVRAMTAGGNTLSTFGSSAMTPTPVASPTNTAFVSDSSRSERHWVINVPAGTRQIVVKHTTGSGDPDLYLKRGAVPIAFDQQNDSQNCVPFTGANPEYCVINDPLPGDWFIMSQGFSAYTNLTLEITLPGDVVLVNDANWLNVALGADNAQWARNMVNFSGGGFRAAGNVVYIDRGRASPAPQLSWPLTDLIATFNSQGYGVGQISSVSGSLTSVPSNVKLLIMFVPVTPYTQSEIDFFRLFVRQGGRILYVGEYNGFLTAQGVASLNQFVGSFGSSTVHKNDAIYTQPPGPVTADQITAGVGTINFGLTNAFIASGFDKVLNTGSDGQAFMVLLRPTWIW